MGDNNIEGTLYINGEKIGTAIKDIEFIDTSFSEEVVIPNKISITFNNIKIHGKALKRLFKLPRKKKKQIMGTRSAINKLEKLITLGLPFTMKHIKRAGLKVEIGG